MNISFYILFFYLLLFFFFFLALKHCIWGLRSGIDQEFLRPGIEPWFPALGIGRLNNYWTTREVHIKNGRISSFLMAKKYSFKITILFIHLPVNDHLGCFYFLAIANNAKINIEVHISHPSHVFISFGYIPKSVIVEL